MPMTDWIQARIDQESKAKLLKLAKANERSEASQLRLIVHGYLKAIEKRKS